MRLGSIKVTRRNGTIFIPLPKEMWQESPLGRGCACGKCNGDSFYDTLAVAEPQFAELGLPGHSYTWMVHYPELREQP